MTADDCWHAQRVYFLNLEGEAWLPSLGLAEADWEFYRQAENQAQRRLLDQEWAQLQEDRQVGDCVVPACVSCGQPS